MSGPIGRPAGDRDPSGPAQGLRRTLWKLLVALALALSGALRPRRRRRPGRPEGDPSDRHAGASRGAELAVAALLVLTMLATLGFVVLFVLHPDTQLLGATFGVGLALLAGALALASARLVPQETKVEERPLHGDPLEAQQAAQSLRAGAQGITRRRLIGGAVGAAGAGLAAAVAVPVAALGPGLDDQLSHTPWRTGRRLVDSEGKPVMASDVGAGGFLTAFAEGADFEQLGSSLAVVRVDPATLRLPAARAGWAPDGILAYSKICTHAACPIALYRSPLSPSTQSRGPALVCPCHYSTFDVLEAGRVEFGPAGRALPQLPLAIDAKGALRAAGPLSGPIGPSWWGDRQ
jgi:ubiquinol-cytochrome c reductase iron-sulfur subunit